MKIEARVNTITVYVDGHPLEPGPSQEVRNHSPDGFAWGYHGSGPAQLALAILLTVLTRERATRLYQQFKRDVIATKPMDRDWTLDIDVVDWANSADGNRSAPSVT